MAENLDSYNAALARSIHSAIQRSNPSIKITKTELRDLQSLLTPIPDAMNFSYHQTSTAVNSPLKLFSWKMKGVESATDPLLKKRF
jgi:hypothetical protein